MRSYIREVQLTIVKRLTLHYLSGSSVVTLCALIVLNKLTALNHLTFIIC